MNNPPHRYVDPTLLLREAMARRLYRRSVVNGRNHAARRSGHDRRVRDDV